MEAGVVRVRIKIRGLGMHYVNKIQVSFYDKLMLLERKKVGTEMCHQKTKKQKPRSNTHFVRTSTKMMHSSAL